jgi:hypothetical protein
LEIKGDIAPGFNPVKDDPKTLALAFNLKFGGILSTKKSLHYKCRDFSIREMLPLFFK